MFSLCLYNLMVAMSPERRRADGAGCEWCGKLEYAPK